jgi:hypothetical protein
VRHLADSETTLIQGEEVAVDEEIHALAAGCASITLSPKGSAFAKKFAKESETDSQEPDRETVVPKKQEMGTHHEEPEVDETGELNFFTVPTTNTRTATKNCFAHRLFSPQQDRFQFWATR